MRCDGPPPTPAPRRHQIQCGTVVTIYGAAVLPKNGDSFHTWNSDSLTGLLPQRVGQWVADETGQADCADAEP